MAIGGVVSAAATNHTMLVAGRVLVGIGMSPAECLAGVLVADLFFVVSSFACNKKGLWVNRLPH